MAENRSHRDPVETAIDAPPHSVQRQTSHSSNGPDGVQGINALERRALKGETGAQLKLADMYLHGTEVEQNYDEAIYWYEIAAEDGESEAQISLSELYFLGLGVKQNDEEAMKLLNYAADRNNNFAMFALGSVFYLGRNSITRNYSEAEKWLRKAIDHGSKEAALILGQMYEHGNGVESDHGAAIYWYRIAAKSDDELIRSEAISSRESLFKNKKNRTRINSLTPIKLLLPSENEDCISRSYSSSDEKSRSRLHEVLFNFAESLINGDDPIYTDDAYFELAEIEPKLTQALHAFFLAQEGIVEPRRIPRDRQKWAERPADELKMTPAEFILRHYATENTAGTLHRGIIHSEDKPLYVALNNWLRGNALPHGLYLPTKPAWNTAQLHNERGIGSFNGLIKRLRELRDPKVEGYLKLHEVEKKRPKTGPSYKK